MIKNNIQPAVPQDLPTLKTIIDRTELFPSELLNDMIASFFNGNEESGQWLTYKDKEPIGLIYYIPEPMTNGTYNALLLAVNPDYQGKGVGATLMQYVEDRLREQGARVVLVETSGLDSFELTRQFYRKIGYEEEARIREFYAKGEDKIVFRKEL